MDWISNLQTIRQKLEAKGFADISKKILEEQLAGGTGREVFSIVVEKLIEIKREKPEAYAVVREEEETEWMIQYARTIGYLP